MVRVHVRPPSPAIWMASLRFFPFFQSVRIFPVSGVHFGNWMEDFS